MRVSLKRIGGNGLKMLLLSMLTVTLTAGLSWVSLLAWIWRQAKEYPYTAERGDTLLVPGVRLKTCEPVSDFRARLERAVVLWHEKNRTVAVLGGHTSPECPYSEAAVGRTYLRDSGVSAGDVVLEDQSLHTLENLRRARELFGVHGTLVLISNRYHLPRLCITAKRLGLNVQPCAAEERLQIRPKVVARLAIEAFYMHWYLTGLGWALLVGDKASLDRIS